jgi:hypothetical protein
MGIRGHAGINIGDNARAFKSGEVKFVEYLNNNNIFKK